MLILHASEATLKGVAGLVRKGFDYVAVTYKEGEPADGEIETVVYRDGGATGEIVATLALTYDPSGNLSVITKT